MKRFALVVVAALLAAAGGLMALPAAPQAQSGPPILSVDTNIIGNSAATVGSIEPCRSVSPGSGRLTVDIVIQDVASLSGFEADLFYDPTVVNVVGMQDNFILGAGTLLNFSDFPPDSDGRFHIVLATTGEGSGDGVVIRLTLQPVGAGFSPLDLENVRMKDFSNNDVQPVDASRFYIGPINDGALAVGPGDSDGDGWTDCGEFTIGTDPLDACADNLTDAANPADMNNDTVVDISDIVPVAGSFGQAVPPAPARHDIAPDPPDGFVDINDIIAIAGLFGLSCAGL